MQIHILYYTVYLHIYSIYAAAKSFNERYWKVK
jgi:hypothetical protein